MRSHTCQSGLWTSLADLAWQLNTYQKAKAGTLRGIVLALPLIARCNQLADSSCAGRTSELLGGGFHL